MPLFCFSAVYAALTNAPSSGRLSGDSSDTGGCPVGGVLSENSPLDVGELSTNGGAGGQVALPQTNVSLGTAVSNDPIDKLYSMHSSYFT